jgi:polyisoprenoid-binding protein YceI
MLKSALRNFACCAALVSAALGAVSLPVRGEVTFTAHGPAGLKIEGQSSAVSSAADPTTIAFTLELSSLKTGIEVRDRHMREDLQVQTYPTAELRVPRSGMQLPPPGGEVKSTCHGALTLHGQTRDVTISYDAKRTSGYDVSSSFQIDVRDYGIAPPTYLGVAVKPDVQIAAELHLDAL